MLALSLTLWWIQQHPEYTRLQNFLMWFFDLTLVYDRKLGEGHARIRVLGVQVSLDKLPVLSPKNIEKAKKRNKELEEIAENGVKTEEISEKDVETDENLRTGDKALEKEQKWAKRMVSSGKADFVNLLKSVYDTEGNLFIAPDWLVSMEIGAKIAFGTEDDHVLAHITGLRKMENGRTIYYCAPIKLK